jgi:hypothetical protein
MATATAWLPADPGHVFWLLAGLHIVGLASMFLSRLPSSHRVHALVQPLFLACLVFVGLATMITIVSQSNFWVWSGTTFSMMAVGATADFGQAARSSSF